MPPPPHPASLYQHVALIGAACSSPKRLQLLMLLSQAPKTVGPLADQTGQSLAATSAHLQALKKACLVAAGREGQQVRYRLADPEVYALLSALMTAGIQLLPAAAKLADDYLRDPETLADVTPVKLHGDLTAGRVTLIDLRPADEYAAGHLPAARSIPHTQLVDRLDELPARRRVVGYCRGPYCLSALRDLAAARDAGRTIRRLPFGINEWREADLPLKTSTLNTES